MKSGIKEFNRKVFGDRLRELRAENKVGQTQLAEELELSNASISNWETGKHEPSASALFKLAQYFDVGIDYLLGLRDY